MSLPLAQAGPFGDQATTQIFVEDVLYAVASLAVILVVLGLTLIDTGLSRRRNVLDTVVQKLAAALIAGFATFIGGYAIWAREFYRVAGQGWATPARVELGAGSH